MAEKLMSRLKKSILADAKNGKSTVSELEIDFPQQQEQVLAGHYAIRVTANNLDTVQISINDSDWKACRQALGYFWHDWTPRTPGKCNIFVRGRLKNGRWKKSGARSCTVVGFASN